MSHNNNVGGNVVYCGVTLFVGSYALFCSITVSMRDSEETNTHMYCIN